MHLLLIEDDLDLGRALLGIWQRYHFCGSFDFTRRAFCCTRRASTRNASW